jgi:hypothetical protein
MNPVVKAKWLTALRSGEYKQGTNRLRTDASEGSSFCCLGVLCDVAAKEGVTAWKVSSAYQGAIWQESPDNPAGGYYETCGVPPTLQKWAGLQDESGSFDGAVPYRTARMVEAAEADYVRQATNLVTLNDDGGWSFERIADLIEERF